MADWKAAGAIYGEPTAEDRAVRDAVLEIALQHAAKEIDHWEVRRQCSGPDRHTAARFTSRDDAAFGALMVMLDDLIAQDPTQQGGWQYRTRHGYFGLVDIEAAGGRVERLDGRLLLRFPVRMTVDGPIFEARERGAA